MAHNNGIITVPIDVYGDIAAVLGIASGDVGTLCTSSSINKKSKYIPFSDDNNLLIVDDNVRKYHNWGHYYSAYTSVASAIADWSDQFGFFPWRTPSARFRVLDFNGYDQNAGDWFACAPAQSPVANTRPKLLWTLNWEDLFGTYIGRIGVNAAPSSPYTTYNFGFLMTQTAPSSQYAGTPYFYQVTDIRQTLGTLPDITANEDGGRIPMIINNTVPQGTWYVIPCFTDYTGFSQHSWNSRIDTTMDGSNIILFPFCNTAMLTVNSGGGGGGAAQAVEEYEVQIAYINLTAVDPSNLVYDIEGLEIYIGGTSASNPTASRTLTVSVGITDAVYGGNIVSSSSVYIPQQSGENMELIREDHDTPHRFQSGSGESKLSVSLTLTIQGETATKTFAIPILT